MFSDVIEDEAVWCHSKNTAYEEGAEVITEAEADNIRDGYKYQKLEFTPFITNSTNLTYIFFY